MAELLPPLPHVYFIINRVLSPSGVKLAAQYNGLDNKLTLAPFDEANDNQRWLLDQSLEKSTTIVPFRARNEQAAPRGDDLHDGFVLAEVPENPHLWVFKDGSRITIPIWPPPLPQDVIIEELGKAHPGHGEPGPQQGRIWGAEKAVPGDKITLKHDQHSFSQRWILEPTYLKK